MLWVVVIGGRGCSVESMPCLERPLAVSAQGVRGHYNCKGHSQLLRAHYVPDTMLSAYINFLI